MIFFFNSEVIYLVLSGAWITFSFSAFIDYIRFISVLILHIKIMWFVHFSITFCTSNSEIYSFSEVFSGFGQLFLGFSLWFWRKPRLSWRISLMFLLQIYFGLVSLTSLVMEVLQFLNKYIYYFYWKPMDMR